MKKGIISIVLFIAMIFSLLPTSVYAEMVNGTTLCDRLLVDGMYYIQGNNMDELIESNSMPNEDIPYLYYSGNELKVVGNISLSGPRGILNIKNEILTIGGDGSLDISNDFNIPVIMGSSDKVILKDDVDFTADSNSGVATINGGTITNAEGYLGDVTLFGQNIFINVDTVDLETAGDINIAGLNKASYLVNLKELKLKGEKVGIVNFLGGSIVNATDTVEIISNNGDLNFVGEADAPIISGKDVNLVAPNIIVQNDKGAAINGDLVATSNVNITIESRSTAPAITGMVDIRANEDISINSRNNIAIASNEEVKISSKNGGINIFAGGNNPVITVGNKSVIINAYKGVLVEGSGAFPVIVDALTKEITSVNDMVIIKNSERTEVLFEGKIYNYGGDVSNGIDLTTPPLTETYYKAEDGYIIFQPKNNNNYAKLILKNASMDNSLKLSEEPYNLVLQGESDISEIFAFGNLNISGDGTLNVHNISNYKLPVIEGLSKVNTMYTIENDTYIYGKYVLENGEGITVSTENKLIITKDSELTVDNGGYIKFLKNSNFNQMIFESGASIINNSKILLPVGTTALDIKNLNFVGIGVIIVPKSYENVSDNYDTYLNNGAPTKVIPVPMDFNFGDYSDKTIDKDGYEWNSDEKILTLGNIFFLDEITVPNGTYINTVGQANINNFDVDTKGYQLDLSFGNSGELSIKNIGVGGINGDTIIFKDGANVTINDSLFLGGSGGDNGNLVITGTNTILNVNGKMGAAIFCDTINVEKGATLNVTSKGNGSRGVQALKGGVNVTENSTLKTSCDYGVYIINGKLNVDKSSKLITNANVAPFCIVDTSGTKLIDDVVSLPGMPNGTKIMSKTGVANYWSLVDTNGILDVTDEYNEPVTLIGGMKGLLTFEKAQDPKPGDGEATVNPENPSSKPGDGGVNGDTGDSGTKLNGISKDTVNGFKDSTPKTGDILPITLIVVLPFAWVALLYLGIRLRRK